MRKFLLLTIITLLISVIVPNNIVAKNWTDVVISQPEGYVVDAEGNVTISSAEGLAWLVSVVNGLNGQSPCDFAGKTVSLDTDLDMTGNNWDVPIGSIENPFKGIFDGKTFEISNLVIYIYEFNPYSSSKGLFGYVIDGVIQNLGLYHVSAEARNDCAALALSVVNSVVKNCYTSGYVYAGGNVSGMILEMEDSELINCYTWVEELLSSDGDVVGGLIGKAYNIVMKNCYSASHYLGSYNENAHVGTLFGERYDGADRVYSYGWANGKPSGGWGTGNNISVGASQFNRFDDGWFVLIQGPEGYPSEMTLLDALNNNLDTIGDESLRTWVWSEGDESYYETYGLPVFDYFYSKSCTAPISLSAKSLLVDDVLAVELSWVDTCDASSWEIYYGGRFNGGNDTVVLVETNPCIIKGIKLEEEEQVAVYEFKVRAKCDELHYSKWSNSKFVSLTWDIDENVADNLEIYPNPANDVINIKGVDVNSIHIYNVQGQLLTKKDCELGSDASIDISFLESGLYLMQIYCGSNVINRTFVKK